MNMYSQRVMDHFLHPRNKGKLKDADAVGKVGNPVCGDVMHVYIKIKNGRIDDIGWETMGCAAAIATTSMLSELAKGMPLDDAMRIDKKQIVEALEGLPKIKMHCSNLAAEGLQRAINNYYNRDTIIKNLSSTVTVEDAETLFKEGITSLDDLRKSSIEFLSSRLSETSIENIRRYLQHSKKQQ